VNDDGFDAFHDALRVWHLARNYDALEFDRDAADAELRQAFRRAFLPPELPVLRAHDAHEYLERAKRGAKR
jgi:hypothetical protein